ncbi:hypothetical protein Pmani_024393 [Petrolisthes manimaculis]|uniref:protein-disulfide reductase n=1 Tax=Petrolisthes manimaculis TaxID=1843537 RepID=A0AAE1PA65_9EUCA|nr:hypothetical protein Pmani_024393 [Petrolisthes manimaculis]
MAHPTLLKSVGEEVVGHSGGLVPLSQLCGPDRVLGLYFAAHWCGPCRVLTPQLVAFYNHVRENTKHQLELVLVSSDTDQTAFTDHFADMPWHAVPFTDAKRKVELCRIFVFFDSQKLLMKAVSEFGALSVIQNSVKACGSVPEDRLFQQITYHQCLVKWLEKEQISFSLPVFSLYFEDFSMGHLVLTVLICIYIITEVSYYYYDYFSSSSSSSTSTFIHFAKKEVPVGHEGKQMSWHMPLLRTPMPIQQAFTPVPHIPVLRTPLPQRNNNNNNNNNNQDSEMEASPPNITSSLHNTTLSPNTTHLHNTNNNQTPHIFTTPTTTTHYTSSQHQQPPPTTHLHNTNNHHPLHIFTTPTTTTHYTSSQHQQPPPTTHLHNTNNHHPLHIFTTPTTTTHYTSSQHQQPPPTTHLHNTNNNQTPHIFTTHQHLHNIPTPTTTHHTSIIIYTQLCRIFVLSDSQNLLMKAVSEFGALAAIENSVKACGSVREDHLFQQIAYHQCLVKWLEKEQISFSLPVFSVYFEDFIIKGILVLIVLIYIWKKASRLFAANDSDFSSSLTQFARKEVGHEGKQTTWHMPLLRTPMPVQQAFIPMEVDGKV